MLRGIKERAERLARESAQGAPERLARREPSGARSAGLPAAPTAGARRVGSDSDAPKPTGHETPVPPRPQ